MSLQNPFPNLWHHRRVAASAPKACWICYKPSTSVLITPKNEDFFYICTGHLSDKQFCRPEGEEAAAVEARKKKEELEREIEKVKKEYEEKQKLKREKREGKGKDKGKDKDSKEKDKEDDKEEEKAKDDKIEQLSNSKDEAQTDLGPRIFVLNKNFYQMRVDRIRNAMNAKRNRETMSNPSLFPSVPRGDPSSNAQ